MVTMIRSDLDFILAQIKIAEADARGEEILGTLVPNSEIPWGLRRVDGSGNNLVQGQFEYGAADQPFPRGTHPFYLNDADGDSLLFGPPGTPVIPGVTLLTNTDYGVHAPNTNPDPRGINPGDVVDADPRIISNLIADQTVNNPAAVYKALEVLGWESPLTGVEVISGLVQQVKDGVVGAAAALEQQLIDYGIQFSPGIGGDILRAPLFVENTAPDEGLSAPFNSFFTIFGQFFDHGLDLVQKGGWGTVYIPLGEDDPLYVPGSATNWMAVSRSTVTELAGEDGILEDDPLTAGIDESADNTFEATNLVTPFVDQNQTYTSHPSSQVFHREYVLRVDPAHPEWGPVPFATGRLLNGAEGGLATWAEVKAQALNVLGIALDDFDIHNIPLLATDAYGNFIRGDNGMPKVVFAGGEVETSLAAPVDVTNAIKTGHAFLDDIANPANPGLFDAQPGPGVTLLPETPDADTVAGSPSTPAAAGTYDNELLDAHYITGDGRGNENIALTAIHHVFHSEHNRQVDLIKDLLTTDGDVEFLNEWLLEPLPLDTTYPLSQATIDGLVWNGERLFQAAKFPTEMQYQHLVFEEFARKVQPFVNVFNDYNAQLDPAILAEFAHTVYRFGHSMLNETVDRFDADYNADHITLIEAFLNPVEFADSGATPDEAAGAIARGMTRQAGNEIDEFVTEALRNNLLGLPLDLAAINIARGRETGVPTLNEARAQFFAGTGDSQLKPYESWFDFALNIKNPASIVNFIAAYGTHDSLVGSAAEKRDAATKLVLGDATLAGQALIDFDEDRVAFLTATGDYAGDDNLGGLNSVDFWIGGLAEKKLIFGGMLGSTFNFVFETQLEALQNGDRFYYLSRLANLNLTAQLENNKFSEIIHRNTDATHLPGDVFSNPDYLLEVDQTKQFNGDLGAADPVGEGGNPFLLGVRPLVIRDAATNLLQYTSAEHVVLGGTEDADILIGGLGDDTLWGDGGDDRLEGGQGNDLIFGGDGHDIITDLFGDDEIRSGAGDDVVSAGQGINLIITDTGRDFIYGSQDIDEILAGQDDDFLYGGEDQDLLIGGEGNDWIEGGGENNLHLGDNGDLIQGLPIKRSVDSPIVGHDVLVSSGGNEDFDAEQGNDIMVGGLGTDRFFGQFGFDWVTHKNDPFGLEADMNIRLFSPPALPGSPAAILDRYAQVEAMTGSAFSDILRGDDEDALAANIEEAPLTQALFDADVALIDGLAEFLGAYDEAGAVRFSTGNILMGGGGSDIIEGRGGGDLIDGDLFLNVRISVRDALNPNIEIDSANAMSELQTRMFSGEIKVSQLQIVRELLNGNAAGDVDTAEFSGAFAEYEIEGYNATTGEAEDLDEDGFITVSHDLGGIGLGADGVDLLKNIERARFSDVTVNIAPNGNALPVGAPTISGIPAQGQLLTASVAGVSDADNTASGGAITGTIVFNWQVELVEGSGVFTNIERVVADEPVPVTGPTITLNEEDVGLRVRVVATYKDQAGVIEKVVSDATDLIAGAESTTPTAGDDLIIGTVNADTIDALAGDDIIFALGGADVIAGGLGSDIIDGGDGDDVAVFEGNAADWTFEINAEGVLEAVHVVTGEEDALTSVETARFDDGDVQLFFEPVGAPTFQALGSLLLADVSGISDAGGLPAPAALAYLWERSADGLTGWSTAPGSTASSSYEVAEGDNGFFRVTVSYTDGFAFQKSVTSLITARVGSDLDVAETVFGNDGDNFVAGRGGNDVLRGREGEDVLAGGSGDDRYFVNSAGDTVVEDAGNGDDRVMSSVTHTLSANVERLFLTGTAEIDGFGSADGNRIQGNAAANTINGFGGTDRIFARGGDDEIVWNVGGGRDYIDGGEGTDTVRIFGDATAETFRIYNRANAIAAGITVLAPGTEIVITRNGTGNGSVVALLDNVEEIIIDGQGGGDTFLPLGPFGGTSLATSTIHLVGSSAADTLDVSNIVSEHRVVFHANGGEDTIIGELRPQDVVVNSDGEAASTSATATEPPPAPALPFVVYIGTSATDVAVGGSTGDSLSGEGGDDTLVGLGGSDNLLGGDGDDVVVGGDGDDVISGDGGRDIIDGGAGADRIYGFDGDGDDVITGGADVDTIDYSSVTANLVVNLGQNGLGFAASAASGNDTLSGVENVIGGSGDDRIVASSSVNVLNGGDGDDTFEFPSVAAADGDVIEGFAPGDTINLAPLYASLQLGDSEGFKESATFDAAGQLRLKVVGGDTLVEGNTDGDDDVDFTIKIAGRTNVVFGDIAS